MAIELGFLTLSAQAETVQLEVYPLLDNPSGAKCPKVIVIQENSKPYEGGYTVEGQGTLSAIATSIQKSTSDQFSVTWVATLKPEYRKCQASAGANDHSYLRSRLISGKLFLILDMTGLKDANSYTPKILKSGIFKGNPIWIWGGTD